MITTVSSSRQNPKDAISSRLIISIEELLWRQRASPIEIEKAEAEKALATLEGLAVKVGTCPGPVSVTSAENISKSSVQTRGSAQPIAGCKTGRVNGYAFRIFLIPYREALRRPRFWLFPDGMAGCQALRV